MSCSETRCSGGRTRVSFGVAQLPTFDLANSRYVLNFGADFLGTWNAPVSHARAYGDMRQGRPGVRGHFVQLEARMSQTGASADEWVAIKPGTEGVLALGIAHVIMRDKLRPHPAAGPRDGVAFQGWSSGLPDYAPDAWREATGVSAKRIERLARDVRRARARDTRLSAVPRWRRRTRCSRLLPSTR